MVIMHGSYSGTKVVRHIGSPDGLVEIGEFIQSGALSDYLFCAVSNAQGVSLEFVVQH